jgi:cyclophilin family peptidyl-prolyl cis-trans isomerase/HEAT repeat protein
MNRWVTLAALVLLSPPFALAQAPPVTPPNRKPALKRDRTQRVLYPKIIQCEDERTVTSELIDMLLPPHGGARRRAILALGRIGYPSALGVLIDVLASDKNAENRNAEFRALAAFSLGEIESHYAVAALLERLDPAIEKSELVRARAVEALGKIGSNKLSAAALGAYGLAGIADAIAKQLPSPDAQPSDAARLTGSLALAALLRLRQPPTIEAIAAQLRSPDSELRWQAANALARIRDSIAPAVPALLPLLADKNPLVRANAARALGVAKAAQAVEPLIRLLADDDPRVAVNSINALGAIADPRAVGPLVSLGTTQLATYRSFDRTKNGIPTQQNSLLLIATALGNIKDPRGLEFLNAFRSADRKLGSSPEIEIAVAKFGDASFFQVADSVKLPSDDWKAMSAYAQGLGQLGQGDSPRAKSALLDLLAGKTYGKPDARAVSDILNALSAVKVEGLRGILIDQLKAEDVIVRTTAATLLGELGDSTDPVIQALEAAYKAARADKMNDARIAIIEAAVKLKHPMSVRVLSDEGREEDYVVRLKAAELLRESSAEAVTSKPLQIGRVNTGHDRLYWHRIAQLSESARNPVAVIHTKKGDIRIELYAKDAPMTVDNFIQLSRSGFYNGLTFVRIVPNFVIQGGDPRGDQNGGPGYQIRCEINLHRYETGAVGMALSGKDTGGSQFFITHSPQPHLDGGYTVFGQVIEGMDVVNRIARDDRIERVEVIEPK